MSRSPGLCSLTRCPQTTLVSSDSYSPLTPDLHSLPCLHSLRCSSAQVDSLDVLYPFHSKLPRDTKSHIPMETGCIIIAKHFSHEWSARPETATRWPIQLSRQDRISLNVVLLPRSDNQRMFSIRMKVKLHASARAAKKRRRYQWKSSLELPLWRIGVWGAFFTIPPTPEISGISQTSVAPTRILYQYRKCGPPSRPTMPHSSSLACCAGLLTLLGIKKGYQGWRHFRRIMPYYWEEPLTIYNLNSPTPRASS